MWTTCQHYIHEQENFAQTAIFWVGIDPRTIWVSIIEARLDQRSCYMALAMSSVKTPGMWLKLVWKWADLHMAEIWLDKVKLLSNVTANVRPILLDWGFSRSGDWRKFCRRLFVPSKVASDLSLFSAMPLWQHQQPRELRHECSVPTLLLRSPAKIAIHDCVSSAYCSTEIPMNLQLGYVYS